MTFEEIKNAYSLIDIFNYVNNVFNGQFVLLFLLGIFGVCFIALAIFDNRKALTISLFMTTILSILLSLMQLLSSGIVVVLIGLTAASLFLIRD